MLNPHYRAPHADNARAIPSDAPNAALLIDFDNVTMGMRSDLAKELKHLLDSDIIKGKVTVQRAYADWRRYPQYIVPLSEASIDLIFAPAYGSSKKNATDIRMAIDGMELVFIRPEIGTYILLTGDSDFSSLVLKLKEYGKYVIGIGIQESSSDILVQNCDEYYSYTTLTGLSRAGEGGVQAADAWEGVQDAVAHMASRGDVMRSDRLKQVIVERQPAFDERSLGFKSFSKFLIEAAARGVVQIRRGENGQYDVAPAGAAPLGPRGGAGGNGDEGRGRARKGHQARRGGDRTRKAGAGAAGPTAGPGPGSAAAAGAGAAVVRESRRPPDRGPALDLLARAVREMSGANRSTARDSDVKRKMLSIDRSFSENALGFGKFSKFLLFADKEGVVGVERGKGGNFEVRLVRETFDAKALGLPTTRSAIQSYLANRYKGVGVKTAERLVGSFGTDVFKVLHSDPGKVRKALQRARAETVIGAWEGDYKGRAARANQRAKGRTRPAGKGGSGQARGTKGPGDGSRAEASRAEVGSPTDARSASGEATPSKAPAAQPDAFVADPASSHEEPGAAAASAAPQASESHEDPGAAHATTSGKGGLRGLLPWGRRRKEGRE